ncbi:MAG: hypothetical protein HY240_10245 [Actinobacteria bacterium]|nr:hypothetical protein [Actinomycetota bacterium]
MLAAVAVIAAFSVACGGKGSPVTAASESQEPAGGPIRSTVKDFSIDLASANASTGEVTFAITNEGPSMHEFVVIKTDLAPDALPTQGVEVTEDSLDGIGEAEDIEPGTTASLSLNLAPGSYVVICNIPGHYGQGMTAGFTVS